MQTTCHDKELFVTMFVHYINYTIFSYKACREKVWYVAAAKNYPKLANSKKYSWTCETSSFSVKVDKSVNGFFSFTN